jgi:hypothetical protein
LSIEQVKQEQSFWQLDNNLSYDNRRRESEDGEIIDKDIIKDGKIIKGIDKIKMASLAKVAITEIITTKIMEINKEGI